MWKRLAFGYRQNVKYFRDPLLIFGVLWSAITIFSAFQRIIDFKVGEYLSIVVSQFRRLSDLITDLLFFPWNIEIPGFLDELLTLWILLAGVTARTQQLKMLKNIDFQLESGLLEETGQSFHRFQNLIRIQRLLAIPANIVLWPIIVYSEFQGLVSSTQIINFRMLWGHFFGEEVSPTLRATFRKTSVLFFAVQWLYIIICLIAFFLVNALETYIDKPGLL
jgi:hypothetical protein